MTTGLSSAFVPGRYRNSPMANITNAASAIADHNTEIVLPMIRDSLTCGRLRRIMRFVREVMI